MAQRFYHLILLPNVRQNIATSPNRKLHPLLFRALRKSLYKPAAFFRGILLPMAEGGDCTLREAVVLGAIVSSMTIPPIHASAAILKLCKMTHYSGPTSLFLRVLLNKKYALAYRVIDAVVNHFLSFMGENRQLPVLWHQSLLTFVQRYKDDVTDEQKEALKPLMKKHGHHLITPEIRRELYRTKSKRVQGESMDIDEKDADGDGEKEEDRESE
jgi:essential nuclear protein 1